MRACNVVIVASCFTASLICLAAAYSVTARWQVGFFFVAAVVYFWIGYGTVREMVEDSDA